MTGTQSYVAEVCENGDWKEMAVVGSRDYVRGYLHALAITLPVRPSYRIVHIKTRRVMEAIAGRTEMPIGPFAGFPTPEQYEVAAAKALDMANRIRAIRKQPEEKQ